jgi:hypothetical protein
LGGKDEQAIALHFQQIAFYDHLLYPPGLSICQRLPRRALRRIDLITSTQRRATFRGSIAGTQTGRKTNQ